MDVTPILKRLAARRRARLEAMSAPAAQQATLLGLVRAAQATRFGRDHGFADIRSVDDFQARVPIRRFEDLWAEYWETPFPVLDDVTWPGRIPFFARSSGTTTGRTKHIPITRGIIKSNERAGFDLMTYHLAYNPKSRPLAGRSFIVGGATALEEAAPGIFVGDVSGINTRLTPFWVRRRIFPPRELTSIYDWDEKLEAVSAAALGQRITMLSGMCNWLLMMLDRIRERRAGGGDGPTLPELQLLIHGGVAIDIYRERLARHLDGVRVDLRELYPASEGFVAFADRGPGEGMRMMLDNGIFFEFVPLAELDSDAPTRHWAATIEADVDYALVLSNNAGLWAYLIGDVVRFVDTDPPRLLIQGRVAQQLSPFGEHLIGAEIDEAVRRAAEALGLGVAEYTVGPVLPADDRLAGRHVYVVEPTAPIEGAADTLGAEASARIDAVLREINFDYDRKRTGASGLDAPVVRWLAPGGFEAWMRAKNKMGGQHKVPRITAKADGFATFAAELGVDLEDPD